MPYIGNIVQDFSVNTAMLNTDSVTSIKIDDGTIVNADINDSAAIAMSKLALSITNSEVNASAAIAGTKISPDFGSQDITTTGNFGAASVNITDNSPSLIFTDSANDSDFRLRVQSGVLKIRDDTNSANRLEINSTGIVTIPGNTDFGAGIDVTGATTLTRSNDNQTTAIITNNGTTGGHCLKVTSGGTGAGTNIFSCFRDNQSSESEVLNVNGSGVLTVTPGTSGTVALFASSGTTQGGLLKLRNTQSSNQDFVLAVGGGDNAYVSGRGFFIRDETNSATRLAIDTSGNTSLGTGTPASNTKLLIRDDSATETVMLKLRNYKSSVNSKPTLRFEAVSSTGQGASSDIQGLAGTDAGAANNNGNDSAMKFIVRHGGAGTLREAFTVKNDGNIHFPNGQGIDFGVTSGGNSSSELLADYEEGTFTSCY